MQPVTILKYLLPVCLLTLVIGQLSTTWRQLEQEMGEVEKVGDAREVKEVTEVKVPSGPRGTILNRQQLSPRLTQNVSSGLPTHGTVSATSMVSAVSFPAAPATPSVRQKDSALSSQRLESVAQSGRGPAVSEVSAVAGGVTNSSVEQSSAISSPVEVMASMSLAPSASPAGGLSQNPSMGAVNESPTQSSDSPVPPSASVQAPDNTQKDAGTLLTGVPQEVSQPSAGVSTLAKETMGHGGSPYPLDYEVYKQQYGAQALNSQIMNASPK